MVIFFFREVFVKISFLPTRRMYNFYNSRRNRCRTSHSSSSPRSFPLFGCLPRGVFRPRVVFFVILVGVVLSRPYPQCGVWTQNLGIKRHILCRSGQPGTPFLPRFVLGILYKGQVWACCWLGFLSSQRFAFLIYVKRFLILIIEFINLLKKISHKNVFLCSDSYCFAFCK